MILNKPGILRGYAKAVKKIYESGDATEYSYRKPLQSLLESLIPKEYNVVIIHESKRETFGAPDFKVTTPTTIVGYIETKKPEVNLDKLPKKDKHQVLRYRERLENFLLTNYKDFILYQDGKKVEEVSLLDDDFSLIERNIEKFNRLLERFLSKTAPKIKTPEELALFLAKRARILKDVVLENMDDNKDLMALFKAFKEHLISTMSKTEFADAYAQTIVYGLFMARFTLNEPLNRYNVVFKGIPKSLKVVHEIFKHITSELPDYLEWIIEELIAVLNNVDVDSIREKFRFGVNGSDPFLHFYEDFLATYNPELRQSRGVYYTPIPVVEFIVNSVDELLIDKFNKKLHDKDVTILDPAVGTGTFLGVVLDRIHRNVRGTLFQAYLKERLINNIFGFEILISPYLAAHLKLSMILDQWGIRLGDNERFNIYLTDALSLTRPPEQAGLFEKYLDEESTKADEVKTRTRIFVIIGNPPYDVKPSEGWIAELMRDYLHGLGVEKERKKGVLQDDYIKFIRFAQWKIEQAGVGVVGFITNNSYLDGLVHRKMRQSLMETFDEIYILNLHGNAIKGDTDENVFDIKQGVAIAFFVKLREGKHRAEDCKVYYYSIVQDSGLFTRLEKYKFLETNTVRTIRWKQIHPKEPYFFFVPTDLSLEDEYNKFPKLDEIFNVYSTGVETQKDKVAITYTPEEIESRIRDFITLDDTELYRKYEITDTRDWKLQKVKADLKEDFNKLGNWERVRELRIKPILYRPFDIRWTYFFNKSRSFVAYPRYEVMKHFILGENLGLILPKTSAYDGKYSLYVLVTDKIADKHALLASKAVVNKSITVVFPLYLYIGNKLTGKVEKTPNFKSEFFEELRKRYGNITPEDFLYYVYAVLHDPKYRERYAEFLKFDFPRIPLYDKETFEKYKRIGKELVELHLMKRDIQVDIGDNIEGDNLGVEKVKYDKKKQGVWINKTTILLGIPEEVWNYTIGGYRVIEKYLKGRKGRTLTIDELEHIYRVVEIIKRTIELVDELERIEPKF
ncbi:N-6 DNA methylase [Thermococcus sp. M39]|uniref:type ISP restriction/modification enzyme n=1 Tax=Thermococcus sp. M39 TaxID=1638262 RepID=UPI00143B8C83|nr:type ISP restriction/modification enzyme [Thermococcus sp. M39]NJE09231.1 N-6 DNA methylase [Thermococcus sp. M39]